MTAGAGDVSLAERIRSALRTVPDFPQPGIQFMDISPLLADARLFGDCVLALADLARGADLIAGIEARGFMLAGAVAGELGCGFVPVRKAGKLPPPTISAGYELEYGSAEIELSTGVVDGRTVFVLDDVLATGGTLRATIDLITAASARVVGCAVLMELGVLAGRSRIEPHPPVHALLVG